MWRMACCRCLFLGSVGGGVFAEQGVERSESAEGW